jgi:hypothetical protein
MWLILHNKAPTWEVLQKRNFIGPGWCSQCHHAKETIYHIILECPFTKEVWKEVERMIGIRNLWEGESIEEDFRTWCSKKETFKIRALPLNIAWGVWLARNLKLFEDKETLPLKCAVQAINILNAYPQLQKNQSLILILKR